jgi:3-hydroxyacyl-CoA dehydrogenase
MLYADMTGLSRVAQRMREFAKNPLSDAQFWEPAPLLAKLAAEGKDFNGPRRRLSLSAE